MSDEIQRDRIDDILDEAIRRIRSGELVETARYCQLYPDLADEIQLLMPAILLLERPVNQSAATRGFLPTVPGYQIIREIGRGAMGVVYEAVQKQLSRRVAVKVIRVIADDPVQTSRFCREASTAARLQHPNIVPVFDSGASEGLAYYSMQLIEGRTLEQILKGARFDAPNWTTQAETYNTLDCTRDYTRRHVSHRLTDTAGRITETVPQDQSLIGESNDKPPTTFDLSTVGAAKIILQVAEALAYAHSRGVLHRDIKPSNIMVDVQGRAWITDFGLAWHADAENLTAIGDIVGTMRYLAPEGFSGSSSEQSDLYSLGLTLYELIEGRPAFSQTDRARLICEILEGRAPQLTVDVPVDLSTICSKCIHRKAGDRYATADLLASDLRNFLAKRPIAARRPGLLKSTFRWCERNREVAALGVLLVLVGSCALIAGHLSSRAAQRLEAKSNASFELARTNLQMLLKTVDRFCQTVSDDRRMYSPQFQELRDLLLESAADLNTQFIGDPDVSPAAKLQLASVLVRLGGLGSTEDTLDESETNLIKALDLLLALLVDEHEQPRVALDLLSCYQELGRVHFRMNKVELAKKDLQDSIEIADKISRDDEDEATTIAARLGKSRSLSILGKLWFDLRQFESSETAFNESIRIVQEIARDRPDDHDVTVELANQWTFLGTMRTANLRNWRQAEEPFREAAALYRIVRQSGAKRPDVDYNYAVMLGRTAKWLYMSKQLSTAIETQRDATDILQNLAEEFDYDLAFQIEFGIALRLLSDLLTANDAMDPQIPKILERSEAVLTRAVAGDSSDVVRVMALANTCQAHAEVMQRQNDLGEALVSIERAISTLNLILNDDPINAIARESRYFAAVTRAQLLTDLARHKDSLAEWDLAILLATDSFVELTSMKRTRTQALSGDFVQATQRADEILSGQSFERKPNRHVLSGAAQTFAIAARMRGLNTANDNENAAGEPFARRAVDLLKQYLATGVGPEEIVSCCDDFDCLRNRLDFIAVLRHSAGAAQ